MSQTALVELLKTDQYENIVNSLTECVEGTSCIQRLEKLKETLTKCNSIVSIKISEESKKSALSASQNG